jgi:hypothetical protein
MSGGQNAIVRKNEVRDTAGDAIFPQVHGNLTVSNVVIEDNYIENAGDCGIDITSVSTVGYHMNITAQRNILVNANFRVSGAMHVKLLNNTVRDGKGNIDVDSGQGRPIDIVVEGNNVNTSKLNGIRIAGAQDCVLRRNVITLQAPASGIIQAGIGLASYGNVLVEDNIITLPAHYGIDFANWWISDHVVTIRNNTILDPGIIGIYDNNKNQGSVLIENNTIWDRHQPYVSSYGIRTEYTNNAWIIRYNDIYAGNIAPISAPRSNIYSNDFTP